MRYLSVCSGIEAATIAWHPLGWEPAAFSEIETFPRAVLKNHWPKVPLHGDFTTIKGSEYGPVRLLVGGTPCQDFSVAGLRKGLSGERGNLTLEFLRLAERLGAQWVVWENVPGVLSQNEGRDFGAILGGLVELGYGFAYRVLDAQFVRVDGLERAVPQRRRRVFVIGYLGNWRSAAAVLFERQSLSWNNPPSRQAGQRFADSLTVGANQYSGFCGEPVEVARSLNAHAGRIDGETETFVPISFGWQNSASQSMTAEIFSPTLDKSKTIAVQSEVGVRRLTPKECERLQGFPDGHTDILFRGKSSADGPRYKALGNSMAVNVMRWIGTRINQVEAL